jgi:hypothetical protein
MLVAGTFLVLALTAVLSAGWYWLALKYNRRKAAEVVRWLELALAGQGKPSSIRWISHSQCKVPLRLSCGVFHRAWVTLDLGSRVMPWRWLLSRISGRGATLIFQADLDPPPAFTLCVKNLRWFPQSRRGKTGKTAAGNLAACGRFVISTRTDWQREIPAAMKSLSRSDRRQFAEISFRRRSPHFSATLLLDAIAPGSPCRDCMFETMREVAASASTSLG